MRDRLGSKSPYRQPPDQELPLPPPGCAAVMVAGVLRHGSRNPGKKDVRAFDRLEAKFKDAQRHALAPEVREWLPGWRNPYTTADSHLLVAAGAAEHYGIARRLRERFPHLFSAYHSRRHHFRSSCHERAARSAHAFAQALFPVGATGPRSAADSTPLGWTPVHIVTPDCLRVAAGLEMEPGADGQGDKGGAGWEVDRLTRFFDACPAYEAQKDARQAEKRAFLKGGEVGEVLRNVQQRLPGVELTNDDVAALYVLCGFEVSHFNTTTSVCSLFEEEDMETLEYLEDLKHWYKKSYGMPLNAKMVCPLHHHLLHALRQRARGESDRAAALVFSHGETLLPLMTRLGLFADQDALTASLSLPQRARRNFRTGSIIPMAANLLFILFECEAGSGRHVVLTLHNERPIVLPACGQALYCPLETLLDDLQHDCRFQEECGVSGNESSPAAGAACPGHRAAGGGDAPRGWPTSFDALLGDASNQISPTALAAALTAAVVSVAVLVLLACVLVRRDAPVRRPSARRAKDGASS